LAQFYASLVESEAATCDYLLMARSIDATATDQRLEFYLDFEADLLRRPHSLPILH